MDRRSIVFGKVEIKMSIACKLEPIAGTQIVYYGMVFEEFDKFSCQSCAETEHLAFSEERNIYMCMPCFCEFGFLPNAQLADEMF